jgi:S1-C subfamily serine protease
MAGGDKVHFIGSTHARPGDVLSVDGTPLWRDPEATFKRIDELCGEGASDLFADPIVKEQDGGERLSVSWFGGEDAEPKALGGLDPGMRSRIESDLSARLERLRPALASPELGEKVAAMLNVADAQSITAVGSRAILVNWGTLPAEALASQAGFQKHCEATIGPYLPYGISPRVPGRPWTAPASPARAAISPPRRPPVVSRAVVAPAAAAAGTIAQPRKRALLWPAALLSALFAACLAYAAWPGHLFYPTVHAQAEPPAVADGDAINRSLEERIARLRAELAKASCDADASVLGVPLTADLLGRLDAATVLVLAPTAGALASGSGFFVTPRDILTDRRVVKDAAAGGPVFVASKALGRAVPATIVAQTESNPPGGPGFALLRVAQAAAGVKALPLSSALKSQENVAAGGFPGATASMAGTYRAILNGDTSQIGALQTAVTRGTVMAMPAGGAARLVAHSASISSGNSGGPLVDACGRAVGVDTFIPSDGKNVEQLNFALGAGDAIGFLSAHGVTVAPADGPCSPAAESGSAGSPGGTGGSGGGQ